VGAAAEAVAAMAAATKAAETEVAETGGTAAAAKAAVGADSHVGEGDTPGEIEVDSSLGGDTAGADSNLEGWTVFPLSVVVGAAAPAAVCRWGVCPQCPGVGRCLSGVYISEEEEEESEVVEDIAG